MRKMYHKLFLYDNTKIIAKKILINILPQKEYDYIISISDPKTSHIALKTLIKQGLKSKKIIEYWGDPLYGDITQKSILPKFLIKKEEIKLIKIADKIIYTSPFTLKLQQKIYKQFENKMYFYPTSSKEKEYYDSKSNNTYTVGYYGAYESNIRNILPLYNAFKELKGLAKLNLIGNSDLNLDITENVVVLERGIVTEYEKNTDLFVCLLNKTGTQIPGKLYYMAVTNKPILVIIDGNEKKEIIKFLNEFNRFIICENQEQSIIEAIKNSINSNKTYKPCELLKPEVIAQKILL